MPSPKPYEYRKKKKREKRHLEARRKVIPHLKLTPVTLSSSRKLGLYFMLKVIIVALLILVVLSLSTGLFFLFKDTEKIGSKRTRYALGARVLFASLLLISIGYGFYTGELRIGTNAPWHEKPQ